MISLLYLSSSEIGWDEGRPLGGGGERYGGGHDDGLRLLLWVWK